MPPFVRLIASEYPSTVESHGVLEWDRGDDTDKIEPERSEGKIVSILCYNAPKGDCRGQAGGFLLWFPTHSAGLIQHIPSPS